MARAAFVLSVRPDKIDEYLEAHENVWPEMREAISEAGIRNYTLFRHGNRIFGYLEADDPAASFAALGATDVNTRWQTAMAEHLDARVAEEGPAMLSEVFRLD